MTLKPMFFALVLLIAVPVLAHEANGPNGGRVVDAVPYHVELVANDRAVTVFVTDAADKPVAVTGFKGLAILTVGGKSQRIPLEPQDGGRLAGTAPAALPADVKGVVQVTSPDGKIGQGRFH